MNQRYPSSSGSLSLVDVVVQVRGKVARLALVTAPAYDVGSTATLAIHLVTVVVVSSSYVTVTWLAPLHVVTQTPVLWLQRHPLFVKTQYT